MSIYHTLGRLKKPRHSGLARNLYYSKTYNMAIKVDKDEYHTKQTLNEMRIYRAMTPEEKEVFLFIGLIKYKNKNHILMKYCPSLYHQYRYQFDDYLADSLEEACWRFDLDPSNNDTIVEIVRKYNRWDMHSDNIGVDPDTNALVILDLGL